MTNIHLEVPEKMPGTYPPQAQIEFCGYHWLHAERSSTASVAQWMNGSWYLIGEKNPISPNDLYRRGWEYLGPCVSRPYSQYLDAS